MKRATTQRFPAGWNEKKVRAVIAHYDQQTDEEGAAEIEAASEAPGETWMSVPTELVGAVTRLIKDHDLKGARAQSNTKKARMKNDRN
jgi:hypothetical protein